MTNTMISGGDAIAAFLNFDPDEFRTATLFEGLPVLACGERLYARVEPLLRWLNGEAPLLEFEPDPARQRHLAEIMNLGMPPHAGEAA